MSFLPCRRERKVIKDKKKHPGAVYKPSLEQQFCKSDGKQKHRGYKNVAWPKNCCSNYIVTKAPPINSIDSKCRTKKLKSSRTCLIGYSGFISHEWFLIARGRTHTHIQTSRTKAISRSQACAWFKNLMNYSILHCTLGFKYCCAITEIVVKIPLGTYKTVPCNAL